MADAYGMITFSKSNDCIADLKGLKDLLNEYEWDNSGAKWVYSEQHSLLYIDGFAFDRPQYPTAIPKEITSYEFGLSEGKLISKSPDKMSGDDWNKYCGFIDAPIPLDRLSKLISPFIDLGWIELACVANEKARYVYFECLRIYANGRITCKHCKSGAYSGSEEVNESYCPESVS